MSLGGLIPIGGTGGKKPPASSGASNLTGGLISISGQKSGAGGGGMGDVDMSDFDVDDLLMDNTPTSSKVKVSKASSSPKDKKKKSSSRSSSNKEKDKASNSTSKKSKSKKDVMAFDHDDSVDTFDTNVDDWGSKSKSKAKSSKWDDDSSEFAVAPVKKKNNLDAEFAKMLGLEDDFASAPAADDDEGTGDSPVRFGHVGDNVDDNAPLAFSLGFRAKTSSGFDDENLDTTASSFSYEPRVRGGKAKESGGGGSISFSDGGGNDAVGDRGTYRDPFVKAAAREEDEKDAVAGLSASFFQSEGANDDNGDASSLSFLSTTTNERRGGRGGRRGGGGSERAPIEDPFASSQTGYGGGGRSSSTFDSLFDSSRKTKQDDIFDSTRRENSRDEDTDRDHGAATRTGGDKQQLLQDDFPVARKTISTNSSQREDFSKAKGDLLSELFPSEPLSRRRDTSAKEDDAPTLFGSSSLRNAKDDLLSELFLSEPSSSSLRTNSATTKKAKLSPKEPSKPPTAVTGSGNAKDDLLAELLPSEPPKPAVKPSSRRKADGEHEFQANQQDNLLAEISLTAAAKSEKPSSRTVSFNDSESEKWSFDHHDDKKKPDDSESNSQTEKRGASQESKGGATTASKSRKTGGLNDISSARDSLLMDLFPESPPKPQERRRRSNTPSTSPIKEQQPQQQASSPAKDESYSPARRPPLSPQKSPSRANEQQQQSPNRTTTSSSFLSVTPATGNDSSQPQVSPGRAKTLASPSASSIKEVDFEQSKDSLLEELLSPNGGSKSPASSPFRGGSEAQRRNSYSQSFEDEKDESVGDQSLQHRHRSSFIASSPLRSPKNVAVSEAPRNQAASSAPAGSRDSLDKASPVDRISSRRSGSHPSPAQDQTLHQHQISNELLEESLKKREEELCVEYEAARAALTTTHEGELAKLHAMTAELTHQLHDERSKNQTLTAENMQQQARLKLLEQENQLFLQQVANLQAEKCQLQQDLHSVQTQHALCATQSALFQSERTGFLNQVKNLEDQSRQLVHQLSQEKQDHQATQLRFASFQQEKEQEAQLLKQKEAHQMTKLFQQLQTSLVSLKMLQEQVVDDEVTKHEVENESRLRMITSLETSSRKCAKQTEEECFRLASLLSNLETTLRHYRQEHLEEKERLRQEQLRLNVLASHFQVQTTVMHEKADANTQMLAQYFTSSMQDVRVAESRLAVRRQSLEDEEKQLYDERTRFAVYREEFLQQQARETQKMQSERLKLDKMWKELQRERDDLDDVIASHEEDFQVLQQFRGDLEQEKENIEYRAMQVADMARKFEGFTQQLLVREEEIAREKQEIKTWKHEFASKQQHVSSEKQKLDERELRLHSQLKQMEKSRRRLNDQRKQHLIRSTSGSTAKSQLSAMNPLAVHDLEQAKQRLMEYTRYMGAGDGNNQAVGVDNNRKWRGETSLATHSTSNQTTIDPASNWSSPQPQRTNHTAPQPPRLFTPNADPPVWKDPSGLSSSFRELVEENWKKREWSLDVADAALHKERMWINCIGLDTTPVSGAETAAPSSRQQQHQQQNSGASILKPSEGSNATMSGTKHNQQKQQQHSIPTRQAQSTLPPPPPHPQSGRQSTKRSVIIDL